MTVDPGSIIMGAVGVLMAGGASVIGWLVRDALGGLRMQVTALRSDVDMLRVQVARLDAHVQASHDSNPNLRPVGRV